MTYRETKAKNSSFTVHINWLRDDKLVHFGEGEMRSHNLFSVPVFMCEWAR